MPRRSRADLDAVAAITHAQHGLITSAQLLEAGVSRSTTQRRIRTGGTWQRLLPGTYLVHQGPPDLVQRRLAALLYAGPTAVITGRHAMHVHGMVPEPDADLPVDVLVPHDHARRDAGFVRVERTRRDPGTQEIAGLRVASPARSTIDAARRLGSRHDVQALLARAIQSGKVDLPELRAQYRSAHRRCTALVKDAIESLEAGTRSAPEAELRRLWLDSGLPEPVWNPDLFLQDGTFVASPDAYVEEVGLAVEVESEQFHFALDDWYATLRRQARVSSHGVLFLQVPPQRLGREGMQVMTEVASAIRNLEGRRPPPLVVRTRRSG